MLRRILIVGVLITQVMCWCTRSTLADDGPAGDEIKKTAIEDFLGGQEHVTRCAEKAEWLQPLNARERND